jgi:hypothetical protein
LIFPPFYKHSFFKRAAKARINARTHAREHARLPKHKNKKTQAMALVNYSTENIAACRPHYPTQYPKYAKKTINEKRMKSD